jgi:hypothetical protein
MRAAMRHEPVDRVPVMCQLALGHYFLHSGEQPSAIWFDSATFARVLADFQRRYRFDGLLLNLPGRPANWRESIERYELNDAGERLTWRDGGCGTGVSPVQAKAGGLCSVTVFPTNDNPHTFAADGGSLARADYERIDADDPAIWRTPGYVWNAWHAPTLWNIPADADLADPAAYPDWMVSGLRAARTACPDVSVHMEVFSPFTHLMELFGYQNALMALIDVPDMCHRLLSKLAAIVIAQIRCYADVQPDAILISSAFAGAGFISRAMYSEFVVPHERQIAAAVREYGIPSYVHTCGAIGDRLDLMAETGIDGIDTLDPPPLGTVDLAKAKAEFGQRFFFKGNLDAVNEMLRADDATFERAVRQRLEIGSPGSGYILSSACSVAPHVQPERLARMVELAEEYA